MIETALDAARVVDDFVRGVVGLGEGEIGGAGDVKRRWTDRVFGKWVYSQRHVVHGMVARQPPRQAAAQKRNAIRDAPRRRRGSAGVGSRTTSSLRCARRKS